jgi:hypothetical protein
MYGDVSEQLQRAMNDLRAGDVGVVQQTADEDEEEEVYVIAEGEVEGMGQAEDQRDEDDDVDDKVVPSPKRMCGTGRGDD